MFLCLVMWCYLAKDDNDNKQNIVFNIIFCCIPCCCSIILYLRYHFSFTEMAHIFSFIVFFDVYIWKGVFHYVDLRIFGVIWSLEFVYFFDRAIYNVLNNFQWIVTTVFFEVEMREHRTCLKSTLRMLIFKLRSKGLVSYLWQPSAK